jgi:hypothetical protein
MKPRSAPPVLAALLAVGLVALCGLLAQPASAKRPPTRSERDAIYRTWVSASERLGYTPPAERCFQIRVSTVNGAYASISPLNRSGCVPANGIALFHRLRVHGRPQWRLLVSGSDLSCPTDTFGTPVHGVPLKVLADLTWLRCSSEPALIENDGRGGYKPRSFCPSNHTCFSNAHWSRWGQTAVANATATFYNNSTGTEDSYQTTVTFSHIQSMCGGRRYTQAAWSRGSTTLNPLGNCGGWTGG